MSGAAMPVCPGACLGPCPMVFCENKKSCWENRPHWDVDGLGALQGVPFQNEAKKRLKITKIEKIRPLLL